MDLQVDGYLEEFNGSGDMDHNSMLKVIHPSGLHYHCANTRTHTDTMECASKKLAFDACLPHFQGPEVAKLEFVPTAEGDHAGRWLIVVCGTTFIPRGGLPLSHLTFGAAGEAIRWK